jgi:hypothetical protein
MCTDSKHSLSENRAPSEISSDFAIERPVNLKEILRSHVYIQEKNKIKYTNV